MGVKEGRYASFWSESEMALRGKREWPFTRTTTISARLEGSLRGGDGKVKLVRLGGQDHGIEC